MRGGGGGGGGGGDVAGGGGDEVQPAPAAAPAVALCPWSCALYDQGECMHGTAGVTRLHCCKGGPSSSSVLELVICDRHSDGGFCCNGD